MKITIAAWTFGAAALCTTTQGLAQSDSVPAEVQAELVAKLENYDRGYAARAGDAARVLILVMPGSAKSDLAAADLQAAFSHVDRIGGLPHNDAVVRYTNAAALAQRCRDEHAAVLYVTPGFDDQIDALKAALTGELQ